MDTSDELTALFKRADLAVANARLLVAENDRWRQVILDQFDHMFQIGAEFRAARHQIACSPPNKSIGS